jgi:tripartite-type tricarboxylate transporter receptor subunit TctC
MRRNMSAAQEAFDRLIREDIERWSTVVKTAKLAP